MVSMGSPVTCSTFTSAAPATCRGPRRSRSAVAMQHVHVVAEDLDRHVAAHAGDQLVEAHLDRLGELVVVAGQALTRPPRAAATSSRLRLAGFGHSARGLRMTKLSATLGGIGSVAISAVPILAKTFAHLRERSDAPSRAAPASRSPASGSCPGCAARAARRRLRRGSGRTRCPGAWPASAQSATSTTARHDQSARPRQRPAQRRRIGALRPAA